MEREVAPLRREAECRPQGVDIGLALAELEAVYQVMPAGRAELDGELRCLRVNETLARMNGIPVAARIGRTVREVVPEVAHSAEPIFRRVFETGEPADTIEFEAPTAGTGGELRVWLENATPVKDVQGRPRFVLVTVYDVTDRERIEERLRESEARFRRTADTAPALLWLTNTEDRCTDLSLSWYEFTSHSSEEAIGLGWLAVVDPDDSDTSARIFLAVAERREAFRLESRRPSGARPCRGTLPQPEADRTAPGRR